MLKKQTLQKADTLTNEYIYDWALKLSSAALGKKIPFKLLGATAFIYRCPNHRELYSKFNRRLTDVDFITYGSTDSTEIDKLLDSYGFKKQQNYIWHASTRDIFVNGDGLLIDVFRDILDFCHPVIFKNRLESDLPTIELEEMVLQKLQIVEINDKDFKDLCVLFLEHDLGDNDSEDIHGRFIAKILAKSWGFHHTSIINLNKFDRYLDKISEITVKDRELIRQKINQLMEIITQEPKSLKWKLRSKIGTRMKWYKEVENIER